MSPNIINNNNTNTNNNTSKIINDKLWNEIERENI